jgi:hypothetical protein
MVSGQVVVVEDADVEDGVIGAQAQVEDGAQANGLHGQVVLVRRGQGHLRSML